LTEGSTKKVLFSIIIPNYNKASNIPALLSSIYAHYPHDDFELFFMDDASTDGSLEEAQRFPLSLYALHEKYGPAVLRNMAAKEASGEYLLFMDSDVILLPETLVNFRELCRGGGFGAVSCLEVLPPVIDNWIGYFRTLQTQDYMGDYRQRGGATTAWHSTCGAVRRELFLGIGGFNESFTGADVEDHELAVRMNGLEPILFSPQIQYRHSYPGIPELLWKQFRRASQIVCFKEDLVGGNLLLFRLRYKFSHILSVAVVVVALACPADGRLLYPLLALLAARIYVNRFLFVQALRIKGAVFALFCFLITLAMGLCIVSGAVYGKLRQEHT
jgi:glycosyltransferase involved in cell wall biosynthesis